MKKHKYDCPLNCIKNTSNQQVSDVFFIVYLPIITTSYIKCIYCINRCINYHLQSSESIEK